MVELGGRPAPSRMTQIAVIGSHQVARVLARRCPAVVTELTRSVYAVMIEAGIFPGRGAMAFATFVVARDVADWFRGRKDPVVALLTLIGYECVVHSSRFPTVHSMATIALRSSTRYWDVPIRRRRRRALPGSIVAVAAFLRRSQKHAVSMTGFASQPLMGANQRKSGSVVVEFIGLSIGLRAGKRDSAAEQENAQCSG
jgi:hypothetical protein